MRQSILEGLLVMAYNVGRDNERTQALTIEQGRKVVVEQLCKLVEHVDPGDLAQPMEGLIR